MAYLEDEEMLEDTAIIFVADHGEEFMEHGWLGHLLTLHGEVTRVPMMCYLPGLENPTPTVETTVETRGLHGLILDYLGLERVTDEGETSLLSLLEGESPESSHAFSTVWLPDVPIESGLRARMASIETSEWKLIRDLTRKSEALYRVESDRAEMENILDSAPEAAKDLGNRLTLWLEGMLER